MLGNRFRFIYMIIAGIFISLLFRLFIPISDLGAFYVEGFFISILITIVLWEGNLRLDSVMNRLYPWITNPGRRIVFHGLSSFLFSTVAMFLVSYLYNLFSERIPLGGNENMVIMSLLLGLIISLLLLSIEVGTQFFRHWKSSLTEAERYRNESLQSRLQSLKSQVNPHFLFNNLSVLSSLVYKDQEKAVTFIDQLAKVYRYSLDTGKGELTSLGDELKFIQSYVFLLKIRFENGLSIDTDANPNSLERLLPPMAIQLLVENAIKHNESSAEKPLHILIKSDDHFLVVSNNLQPRSLSEPSSGTGLNNIRERYRFFTERVVEVIQSEETFTVKLPLLAKK